MENTSERSREHEAFSRLYCKNYWGKGDSKMKSGS